MNWEDLKQIGSNHYKGKEVEPIDLYKSGGTFHDFAISSIIKYAYRNRKEFIDKDISKKDMEKIIHFTKLLIVLYPGKKENPQPQWEFGKKAE